MVLRIQNVYYSTSQTDLSKYSCFHDVKLKLSEEFRACRNESRTQLTRHDGEPALIGTTEYFTFRDESARTLLLNGVLHIMWLHVVMYF